MNANITDVARRAGVSIATVSRCLSENYPISKETRKKVMDAVEALNYVPNFLASGLKNKQVKLIGLLLPNLSNNVVLSIAESISEAAGKRGYRILYACSENRIDVEKEFLDLFRSSLVDGIIAATVMKNDKYFQGLKAVNIPVVLFDRYVGNGNIDWVGEDCYSASYELTNYLIENGHRRIAFVKGIKDVSISTERHQGYLDALKNAGIEAIPELQIEGEFSEKVAFEKTFSLLRDTRPDQKPTAIYASSSMMTKGVLNAVMYSGLQVPEDISVASYGEPEATGAWSKVTCIRQNAVEIGRLISELVIRRIEDNLNEDTDANSECIKVPTQLIKGETVKSLL